MLHPASATVRLLPVTDPKKYPLVASMDGLLSPLLACTTNIALDAAKDTAKERLNDLSRIDAALDKAVRDATSTVASRQARSARDAQKQVREQEKEKKALEKAQLKEAKEWEHKQKAAALQACRKKTPDGGFFEIDAASFTSEMTVLNFEEFNDKTKLPMTEPWLITNFTAASVATLQSQELKDAMKKFVADYPNHAATKAQGRASRSLPGAIGEKLKLEMIKDPAYAALL